MHARTSALACISILGLIVVVGAARAATVPQLITYQGILTGPDGGAPANGDYTLSFSIYDKPSGAPCVLAADTDCATRIWGPQVFDGTIAVGHGAKVLVVKGIFNVLLGPYDINGVPIARAFTSSSRFVEVKVENDEPTLPRQQVLSAPFALMSTGDIPIGGIVMFFGDAAYLPANWEVCNGDYVDDKDSPLYGTRKPELRGRFVRGADDQSAVGRINGRDTRDTHRHEFSSEITTYDQLGNYRYNSLVTKVSWTGLLSGTVTTSRHPALTVDRNDRESHTHNAQVSGSTGWDLQTDFDNRPLHINLHYIIRVK